MIGDPRHVAARILHIWRKGRRPGLAHPVFLNASCTAAEQCAEEMVRGRVEQARVYAEAYALLRERYRRALGVKP